MTVPLHIVHTLNLETCYHQGFPIEVAKGIGNPHWGASTEALERANRRRNNLNRAAVEWYVSSLLYKQQYKQKNTQNRYKKKRLSKKKGKKGRNDSVNLSSQVCLLTHQKFACLCLYLCMCVSLYVSSAGGCLRR